MARSGGRWRDLLEKFGPYQTAKRRYYRWIQVGVFDRLFETVASDPDLERPAIDATVIRATDNLTFVNGVLWVLRSAAHWRDLPERYGKWKTVHKRFMRWPKAGVRERVFAHLIDDPDNDYVSLDSSLVRAHQQAATGKGGHNIPEADIRRRHAGSLRKLTEAGARRS